MKYRYIIMLLGCYNFSHAMEFNVSLNGLPDYSLLKKCNNYLQQKAMNHDHICNVEVNKLKACDFLNNKLHAIYTQGNTDILATKSFLPLEKEQRQENKRVINIILADKSSKEKEKEEEYLINYTCTLLSIYKTRNSKS